MFRVHSCRFRNEDYKENCARMFIEREFGVPFSYCIECSQQAFIDRFRNIVDFTEANLGDFGKHFVHSLLTFGIMVENQSKEVERKRQVRLLQRQQMRKGSDGTKGGGAQTQLRGIGGADGASIDKKEGGEETIEEEEGKVGGGGFLGLVRGNNLTLNDYLQMMNTGLYNEFDEGEENDMEIEEYKNRRLGEGDENLSEDSADQCMNREEQENLFQDIL
jgi:hypothetical protein